MALKFVTTEFSTPPLFAALLYVSGAFDKIINMIEAKLTTK